jgi:alternate signal-mediated exported protein
MTTKTTKKGAVKGTVAAAAGVAVLLGGMGTFALWNQSGEIGTTGTNTGHLTASFGTMQWQDVTPDGVAAHTVDPTTFNMVPGDVLEGTATITYSVKGENIVVKPELTGANGATLEFLSDKALTVTTTLAGQNGAISTLHDGDSGTMTAKVTIAYDKTGVNGTNDANMDQTINLSAVELVLQQQAPTNLAP